MKNIRENVDLTPLNTFGISAKAKYFVEAETAEDIQKLITHPVFLENKRLILGSGSNILLIRDFNGLVIQNSIKGIETLQEDENRIQLRVGSGEIWHHLVMHCVQNDFGGIENLSLIPGTVGAAPMQNIGAYGVEVGEVIDFVEAIDLERGTLVSFDQASCRFGYRESIFKQEAREKFFISSVTLTLSKKNHPIRTSYGAIRDTLQGMQADHPTIQNISEAVIRIRQSKLPDPRQLGNAGSFFKNPSIPKAEYESLKLKHSHIPGYETENQLIKIPAGWLIEQCGWKGKRLGNVGVHAEQALVIVHYGGGTGEEIFTLAMKIKDSVESAFGITLTPEVNIIG